MGSDRPREIIFVGGATVKLSDYLSAALAMTLAWSIPGFAASKGDRVIDVQGSVQVKRGSDNNFEAAKKGMTLDSQDWVWVKNGQITLRCASSQDKPRVITWFSGKTVVSRLCPQSIFRRVIGSRGDCDEPARLLSLLRGQCLVWDDSQSLDAEQLAELESQVAAIRAESIGKEAKALVLAELYFEQQWFAGVIDTLKPLVEAESQIPVVHRWLGDAYEFTGKTDLAKHRYQMTLNLAQAEGNTLESGAAAYGLAKLAARQQDLEAVTQWLKQAESSYSAGQLVDEQAQMTELLQKTQLFRQ